MKVLVSAYACEPDKGSEPGVGWHWALQLSRFYDVSVITRSNNRISIEKELALHPNPALHFHYVDVPTWLSFWKKGQRGIYLYYCLWQFFAYRAARILHVTKNYSVVHHVTFGTVWLPTFMHFLGIPFIWGPIGGAEAVPTSLRSHFSFKWKVYERIRDIIIKWTYTLDPISRSAMKRAQLIIARTRITRDAFPSAIREKVIVMIETGVSIAFIEEMQNMKEKNPRPVILMSGRLLHLKGFDLGIEAFSKVVKKFPQSQLIIIGTGPDEKNLILLAHQLNISKNITFTGGLSRKEALHTMCRASIFLIPSMKDAGTWVLYEAMALGLPIVCLDYAGPGEIVDNTCAITIPIGKRSDVISKMSDALEILLSSETKIDEMGNASLKRLMNCFLWDQKGDIMMHCYQSIINHANGHKQTHENSSCS